MTSLSRQLSRLRVPQTSVHREKKGSVSFLYDYLEAKSIDSDTHLAIALSGLQSLIQLDPNIKQFEESLFNESSKSLDRALLSAEDNQQLDSEIESFLFSVVSNYFLLTATHKTIEWLIYRYGVHEYNVNALIASALPYHSTRLFARLIQTCPAPNQETSEWSWLKPIQKNGCPLPKSTLITHCISVPTFLKFICDHIIKCLEIDSKNNTFLTFFVSTLINIIERTTNESIVSIIIVIVIKGLKSKNDSFRRASLCICGHIYSRIQFEQKIVDKTLKAIAKRFKPSMTDEILLTLSIIDRFQHLKDLPSNLISCLTEKALIECHEKYEIENLISLVLKSLLINFNDIESNQKLMTLLDKISLSSQSIDVCLKTISEMVESNGSESGSEVFCKVLSLLELRYPTLFDTSLSKLRSLSAITPLLGSFRYQNLKDSKVPLIFGLTHINETVQKEAIEHLIANFDVLVEQKDELTITTIKSLLSDSLNMKSPQSLLNIFHLKEKLLKIFNEEVLKDICQTLLLLCVVKEKSGTEEQPILWRQLKNSVLATYCSMKAINEDTLFSIIYPFLLPLNNSDLITLSIILKSKAAKESPLLLKLSKKCKKVTESESNEIPIDSIIIMICTQFAKYCAENPTQIRKNIFMCSHQNAFFLKSSALSLIILERIHSITSDPLVKQKSANILFNLIEILLKFQRMSKSNHSFDSLEKFMINFSKNLKKSKFSLSAIIYVINSVIKSMDFSKPSNSESNVWFWFKQFNSDFYYYRLFSLLFNNCYNNNENKCESFRNTFVEFIRKISENIGHDFYAPLLSNERSPLLQCRSLSVCANSPQTKQPFSWITVLSSMIALHSEHNSCRESALNVIKHLNRKSKDSFLKHCLESSESIKNDENSVSYAIADWLSSKKSHSIVNQWIDSLEDDDCPQNFKSGIILLLNKCNTKLLRQILTKMKNYSTLLSPNSSQKKTMQCLLTIYSQSTIFEKIDSKTDIIFNFFINCLKNKAFGEMTVDLIDKKLFESISSSETKLHLLTQLLDLSVDNRDTNALKRLKKVLKCGHLISSLLTNLVPIEESSDYGEPKPKRIFVKELTFTLESNNWKKFIVLLEIIQSKKHLTDISVLVKNLFNYLKKTFIMDSKTSLEYLRQLLLNSLINCMKQNNEDMPFTQIESLIECLRESQQKETQKLALILISNIAHRFKKEIMDYVITIFTFIGTNLLHCDDQYSIQIVFDTMEAILPILLTESNDTKDNVINVFINSLADIPAHRRLVLLIKLLEMLGEEQHLTLIFMKVIERIFNKSKTEKESFLSLIVALSSHCDINIQIKTINQLMDVLTEEFSDEKKTDLISDQNFSENDKRLIAQCFAQFILRIVSSQEFVSAINSSQWIQISDNLSAFLHKIIVSIVKFNAIQNTIKDSNNNRKRIRNVLYQILLQFNSLLPNEQLIELVLNLMTNDSLLIQRNAFELMNEKLLKLNNQSIDSKQLSDLFNTLLSMVPSAESVNQMDEQQVYNTQLSMITCKLLSKHIGDNEKLEGLNLKLLQKIISLINGMKKEISFNLKASSILCMTQLMTCLGNKSIPLIPSIVPIVLKNFEIKDEVIVISNLTSILKLAQNYPQFLSPYLNQILIELMSVTEDNPQIKSRLNLICGSFAKLIPKRVLLTSIDTTFNEITNISFNSLCRLMGLLKETFGNTTKVEVNDIIKSVKNIIIKALDIRDINAINLDSKQLSEMEDYCNEAFSVFIPKLSEITFRPLFYKLYDSAIREKNGTLYHRMISFYKLMNILAHKLKSLFCIFVGPSIVNNCSQILSLLHSDNQSNVKLNAEDSNLLIVSILSTLSNCFLYDINGAFLNKDRMQALTKPIINQLNNTLGSEDNYNQRIDGLSLCTQYLIESNKDETIIKDFNYQILLKTRDNSSQVRLAALKVLRRLILVSGEDYLPIIPETIPFISELSEDDSTSVEDLVKTVINDLEQILGEPITKYL